MKSIKTPYNSTYPKWRVQCFYDSLVQGSSAVFQMNICAENPPLLQAAIRCLQLQKIKNQHIGSGERLNRILMPE